MIPEWPQKAQESTTAAAHMLPLYVFQIFVSFRVFRGHLLRPAESDFSV
jgi:hypothetical protein